MGTALLVAFVMMLILKMAEIITWSWWIVCLPLYCVIALQIIVAIIAGSFKTLFTFGKIFHERSKFNRAMKAVQNEEDL